MDVVTVAAMVAVALARERKGSQRDLCVVK